MNYFLKVMCETTAQSGPGMGLTNERALKKVQELYDGKGRGADLASASGTAWGLLNAVTEYVDHERRAKSQEYRLDSSWFGAGATRYLVCGGWRMTGQQKSKLLRSSGYHGPASTLI